MRLQHHVILAAHGAGDGSNANLRIAALASEIRDQIGCSISVGFNLGSPTFADAIAAAPGRDVIIAPLMTENGHFAARVLRERCDAAAAAHGKTVRHLEPVGAWDEMHDLLVDAVSSTFVGARDQDRSVLVVGHGTDRSRRSGEVAMRFAERVRDELGVRSSRVAFLDQSPSIEEAAAGIDCDSVTVVPFLLGGGGHSLNDLPRRLGALGAGRIVSTTPALGELPRLAEIIGARIRYEISRSEIRLGTRSSRLALVQADRTRATLEQAGVAVRVVPLKTHGDQHVTTPVSELSQSAPFTDDLTQAIVDEELDLATHSLKDLPLARDSAAPVLAYLERSAPGEALVTRSGSRLSELPSGARIGASCERRALQLRSIRADLVALPMRGDVLSRIEQVERGDYEGAILAEAGLLRLGREDAIAERLSLRFFMPAAGQGVIALQGRPGDAHHWIEVVDDLNVRRAAISELTFAREVERLRPDVVAAAYARIDSEGMVLLRGRVISASGDRLLDASSSGRSPSATGGALARHLLSLLAAAEGATT